jgi:hypothetical protein
MRFKLTLVAVAALAAFSLWRLGLGERVTAGVGEASALPTVARPTQTAGSPPSVNEVARDQNAALVSRRAAASAGEKPSTSSTLLRRAQEATNLKEIAVMAMADRSIGGANVAMEIATRCLTFSDVESTDVLISTIFATESVKVKKVGAATATVEVRRNAAREMTARCSGFDASNAAAILRDGAALLKEQGALSAWRELNPTSPSPEHVKQIRAYTQDSDTYLSALWRGQNVFAMALAEKGSVPTNLADTALAFRVAMCQLGSGCSERSLESLDMCITQAVCGLNVRDGAVAAAAMNGLDQGQLFRMSDEIAAAIKRSDLDFFFLRSGQVR